MHIWLSKFSNSIHSLIRIINELVELKLIKLLEWFQSKLAAKSTITFSKEALKAYIIN